MARQETVLSVFVASPSDVEEERNKLEEVIREHNIAWSRELGIRFDLVRWETHAYPSFGKDPQAVINDQIPNDYDIFIGLMWYKFGTPTGRAGSGTVEEFELAKERFDRDPSSVNLMLYFKDAPIPISPTKINPEQIGKLIEFKEKLGEEGGLYWSFSSIEDFEKLVRLHLTRHIQAYNKKVPVKQLPKITPDKASAEIPPNATIGEDFGLLDLMEYFEDEFKTLVEIMERIAFATTEVGQIMNERTEETKRFTEGPNSKNRKAAKRLIDKAAIDMDQYVHRIKSEVPLFSEHLSNGMNYLIKASELSIDLTLNSEDRSQVKENLDSVRDFCKNLIIIEGQTTEFQQSIATLPRMTAKLNRSKSAVVKVLQELIDSFHNGQAMAREAERSLESTIAQHNNIKEIHNKAPLNKETDESEELSQIAKLLAIERIKIPSYANYGEGETTNDLFSILVNIQKQLVTGITNKVGQEQRTRWLFHEVCPKFKIYKVVDLENVPGVEYQKFSLSSTGQDLLNLFYRQKI